MATINWFQEGNDWFDKGDYQKAIECYEKVIELAPNDTDAYFYKGTALLFLRRYEEAIQCYDKEIHLLSPKEDESVYLNKGNALYYLGDYEKAIQCFDKAIELKENFRTAYHHRRISLQALKDKKLPEDHETYLSLFDGMFFDEATDDLSEKQKDLYAVIYFLSLKILDALRIKKEDKHEKNVAHYTSKKVAQILFFDNEKDKDGNAKTDKDGNKIPIPLQLNSVTNSNDIQEGKTLFNYLFDNQKMYPQKEQFVAFVGCFMFNHDNLNQFRLYGKEEGTTEGTGISIVMNEDFFSLNRKLPFSLKGRQTYSDDKKESMFRCIYIDPETNQVVSIGHRDYHTFYKTKEILYNGKTKDEQVKKITEDIKGYKDDIDKKLKTIKGYLGKLKKAVKKARKQELDDRVIFDLLLNLRYLVKHVAFKEEQECRIIKIKRPCETDNECPIDEDEKHQRFYVDYLPLKNCVKKIYFGPKASGMELFQSLLTYQKGFENVICCRSTSPLA